MADSRPLESLRDEHRSIEKVVAAMALLADRLKAGREVKPETLRDVVEFMTTFGDHGHEAKEERYLFPALQKRKVAMDSVPVKSLVEQHQRGAALVEKLASSSQAYFGGNSEAKAELLDSLEQLSGFFPLHIWQEDLLLFQLAERTLTLEDEKVLADGFRTVDRELGDNTRERLQEMAEKIEKESW